MDTPSNISKSSPRLFSIAVLVVFIIILPAGSWYYLKKGADYRLSLQEQLEIKNEEIFNQLLITKQSSNDEIILDRLVGFTTLIVDEKEASNSRLNDLISQYADAYTFKLVKLKAAKDSAIVDEETLIIDSELYSSLFANQNFYLVDTEAKLRNSYGNTEADYNNIVQHIAVILPRTPEKDIKMKK